MQENLDLWSYLEQREEEIVQKRKELEIELAALRQARAALERDQRERERNGAEERLTIKEMVRSVLRQKPEGGTSDQIINWISRHHGIEVARTSLSPQLSRLKAEGLVTLDEDTGIWGLSAPKDEYQRSKRGMDSFVERRNADKRMLELQQKRRKRSDSASVKKRPAKED